MALIKKYGLAMCRSVSPRGEGLLSAEWKCGRTGSSRVGCVCVATLLPCRGPLAREVVGRVGGAVASLGAAAAFLMRRVRIER